MKAALADSGQVTARGDISQPTPVPIVDGCGALAITSTMIGGSFKVKSGRSKGGKIQERPTSARSPVNWESRRELCLNSLNSLVLLSPPRRTNSILPIVGHKHPYTPPPTPHTGVPRTRPSRQSVHARASYLLPTERSEKFLDAWSARLCPRLSVSSGCRPLAHSNPSSGSPPVPNLPSFCLREACACN